MTAGNVDVAFRVEDAYLTPGSGDWHQPGKNITISELDLDNQLEALRDPNNPVPVERLEGNFEGAFGISMTLAGDPTPPWHELVFDSGALPDSGGRATSAEWAIGLDFIGGTAERVAQGAVVTDVSLEWQNGQPWSVDLTILYGAEETNTAFTPTDVQTLGPEKTYNHAATDVDIDGTGVQGLSSLTISLSELARLRQGLGRHPYEATIGGINPTVSIQADFTDESPSNLELAYGGTSEPAENIDAAAIDVDLTNKDGDTLGYDIDAAKPATYGWEELVDPDADEQESITFDVFDTGNNGVSVS